MLEKALDNTDYVTLYELERVEEVVRALKMKKIEDSIPYNPGQSFVCF